MHVSEFVARSTGLHFPPERSTDLHRALTAAAAEFGFADARACAEWVLSSRLSQPQLHALASHLTIGETYFFRERNTFHALAEHVIPELIQQRAGREQRLRIWSAGCCTGEEPYSLAMLLHHLIPFLEDWHVTILATDINERFLEHAIAGLYGEWSFRESRDRLKDFGFREQHFTSVGSGRFALRPQIKQRVTFAPLNLVEDRFPSLATDTHAMDVIFCRNVLMYFTAAQAQKVVNKLRSALREGGWLVVSSSELSQSLFSAFTPVNFPGAILYRKCEPAMHRSPGRPDSASAESTSAVQSALAQTEAPCAASEEATCHDKLLRAPTSSLPDGVPEVQELARRARSLANEGRLEEALVLCDQWAALSTLDATERYLRAIVLQELGKLDDARRLFQQALYLAPDFVVAHIALGNLARGIRDTAGARRHFDNALALLRLRSPTELLAESDGLTAGRLTEIVTSLLALERAQ